MSRSPRPTRRIWHAVQIAVGLGVTAAVFGWLFSSVSLREVLRLIGEADPRGIAAFLSLSLVMSIFRAWRYGLLLRVSGHAPGGLALFLVVLVRNLFADLLPARIGSVIYIYLVKTRLGVPLAAATSSFTLAFLFDLLAMAPLLVFAGLRIGSGGEIPGAVLIVFGALLTLGGIVAIVLFEPALSLLAKAVERLPGLSAGRRRDGTAAIGQLRNELSCVRRAGVYDRVLLLSVLVRLTKYAALYAFLAALVLPRGFALADLDPGPVLIGLLAAEAAASLPASGIAGFGAYEGAWVLVFTLLGFPSAVAKITSLSHHLFTQAWGYGLGGVALLLLLLPVWRRPRPGQASRPKEPGLLFAGKLAGLGGVLAVCLWSASTLLAGPDRSDAQEPESLEQWHDRNRLFDTFPGRILFDSNRSGTFGIYSMEPDGSDVRVVFDSGDEEMYPDASPDGRWIVFSRAQTTERDSPTDVWIVRPDGSDARRLAERGRFPRFAGSPDTITFERDRRFVMTVGRTGGRPQPLFSPKKLGFGGRRISTPSLSPDGETLFFTTDRPDRWNAWGIHLPSKRPFRIGHGCQPIGFREGEVLWVRGSGARAGSGIFAFATESGRVRPFQDDGPPRGHEYFPALTPDLRFLLYAAAPEGQHSHITSNYQLFVRDIAAGAVVRVTRDAFNNRWPRFLPRSSR